MAEAQIQQLNTEPAFVHADLRATLAIVKLGMAAYEPDGQMSIPTLESTSRGFTKKLIETEALPQDILVGFAANIQFHEDASARIFKREPNYHSNLRNISDLDEVSLKTLYEANNYDNPLLSMMTHQVSDEADGTRHIDYALEIVKKVYGVATIPELIHSHPEDPVILALEHALRTGAADITKLFTVDTSRGMSAPLKSQERRKWMRDALQMATDIRDPEQADAYILANSRSFNGEYDIKTLIKRINEYGSEKLASIESFANISALSSYSDGQLERMYKLSQGDVAEIARLQGHDVIVTLINMDGDHNGVSDEVAKRLDDDAERTLFFEIDKPEQVYHYLKKLHDLVIQPSTLIFASHGSAGQFIISERPALDSDVQTHHVTTTTDQELIDNSKTKNANLKGYDIARANGLYRSIERFMQPSRAIDDPDKDLGRKKIISLSCQFAADTPRVTAGQNGERIMGAPTSLLKRLGEVLIRRFTDEHIDIYGADISTYTQTRTPGGFHYNQLVDGLHVSYPATKISIDGKNTEMVHEDEVQLRKV